MQALTLERQTDLRAYWLVQHSDEPDRAMLSAPATYGDLLSVLATSRGIDPKREQERAREEREDLLRRIAKHSGVDVSRVRGSIDGQD